jgi:hypothetical protein
LEQPPTQPAKVCPVWIERRQASRLDEFVSGLLNARVVVAVQVFESVFLHDRQTVEFRLHLGFAHASSCGAAVFRELQLRIEPLRHQRFPLLLGHTVALLAEGHIKLECPTIPACSTKLCEVFVLTEQTAPDLASSLQQPTQGPRDVRPIVERLPLRHKEI